IEIASETINRLPQALQSSAKAILGDIGTYDPHEKYDIVFMIEIAEHMHDWQLKEGFEKINKILSPEGRLIIMTPNYYYEKILSPLKRILNIPGNLIKWPLRVIRGKYKPASFLELAGKIFRVGTDRGELNKKMHVNITTRGTLKKLLSGFDVKIWCEDHSKNLLSLLTGRWWGREIILIASKKDAVS
ncbi:MAG: class I SAM-dependent methyltransferase, partial [Parabacteroides sp.]|nr:class I SAM-dependent methyltransferase [Parabacteroides sp.]